MIRVSKSSFNLFLKNFVQSTKMWTKTNIFERKFSRNWLNLFEISAKFVQNYRKIRSKFSQNSQYSFENFGKFARIQSSWCEMERFRFWQNENWSKISRTWKISFVHFREFRSTKISMETLVLIRFQKNQSNLIFFFWDILSKLLIY